LNGIAIWREFVFAIAELVSEVQAEQAKTEVTRRKKVSAKTAARNKEQAGKVRYVSPTGERGMFIPGSQPRGWLTTSRKAKGAK
jgi:hypothetical protein